MEFRVLGPLEATHDGVSLPVAAGKQRALLADLLLNANRAMPTARLVDDLWGDDVPETAVKALQVYVSKLRKILPEARLHTRGPGYQLDVHEGELDLGRFERLVVEGRRALDTGSPEVAGDLLAEALTLWHGPALADLDAPFALREASRLEELRLAALEDRIAADLAVGRHTSLVPELESLAAAHPLRERLRAQLMTALYRSGRQAEALEAYQRYRRLLADELGIDPTQSLRELERRILQQDATLDAPTPATKAPVAVLPALSARATSPLVGRAGELGALARLLAEALGGTRRVAFVTGEAGAGKTTLVDALLETAGGQERLLAARGQCVDNRGHAEPYLPMLDALGRIGRGEHRELLVERLRRFAPTWLAQLPSLVDDDRRDVERRGYGVTTERMLREMTEALEALADEVPVALVLEDLHWSDPSTIALVETIARRTDPARLLLILTTRTGEEAATATTLARSLRLRNLCSEVAVGPLNVAAITEYLDVRLPGHGLPGDLAADVRARTRGIPLFVEKLVDSWLDSGAVVPSDEGWTATVPVSELRERAPETLRELIAERCRPLDPAARAVLDAASVVGTEFTAALAGAGAGHDEEAADALLAAVAVDRSLIEPRGEERWPDGTVTTAYAFTHDLVQETLYDELRRPVRARLHGAVARRLESGYGERAPDVASALAWHFTQSGDAEHAVQHLVAAGGRAFAKTAAKEALAHVEAALRLVPEIGDEDVARRRELSVRLLEASSRILIEGWSSEQVVASLERAIALARLLGDLGALGQALVNLAGVHEICGRYAESERLAAEALALPDGALVGDLPVTSNELMACSLVHQGRHEQALEAADVALELSGGHPLPETVAVFGETPGVSSHVWGSQALLHLGRPNAAMLRAEQGVAAAATTPRAYARGMASANAAIVSQSLGNRAGALRWAEAAIEASEYAGYPYWQAAATIVRGWVRAVEGEPDAGLAELQEAIAAARATGARLDEPYFLALLADVHLAAGRIDDGLAAVDEALDEMVGERSSSCEPELWRLRGELLLATGDEAGALEALERALGIAAEHGSRAYELRAALSVARARRDRDSGARLARVLATFSEGAGAADVVAARELLADLGIAVPEPEAPAAVAVRRPPVRAPIQYARSGELSIAYQVTGGGPVDIVLVPGFVSHLEKDWEDPRHERFLDRLGSIGRLIRFDKRGTGLSDRPPGLPDLETRMDDVRAVMDASGSERAIIVGYSEGGPLGVLLAATYPERVEALVLYGTYAKRVDPDADYPWAATREARAAHIDEIASEWGYESHLRNMCPSADDAMARWWGERCRAAASPGAVRALLEMNSLVDVRDALSAVHVPTLVLHRRDDLDVFVEEGRYVAERIAGARFVELEGRDHFVAIEPDQLLDVVEPFVRSLAGMPPAPEPVGLERMLATMMFTDIVASTETAVRLGDADWSTLLERHNAIVREELARYAGQEIDTTGDGFLAVFDGPARAIRCGRAISERVRELGVELRVGVHTGEVERQDGTLRGVAVHVAARVAAAAGAGEVLVSASTCDLVAGSGLEFVDRGDHELKGLTGPRRLYAAAG